MKYSVFKIPRNLYLGIAFSDKGISALVLPKKDLMSVQLELTNILPDDFLVQVSPPEQIKNIFNDYFRSRKVDFNSIDIIANGTSFEQNVWNACRKIPYGEVRSYSWIAKEIGKPSASRAVGNALNKNPIPIIVPCHRVISTSGLGGFAEGLKMKRMLLELESR